MHSHHGPSDQDPQYSDLSLSRDRDLLKAQRILSRNAEAFIQFDVISSVIDWDIVGRSLDAIQQVKSLIPEEVSSELNRKFSGTDFTLLHYMIMYDAPTHLIHQMQKLGADMKARYSYMNEGLGIDLENCTPLHLAAYSNNFDALKTLIELGHDPCVETADGSTVLTFHFIGEHSNNKLINLLRRDGVTLKATDLYYLSDKDQRKWFKELLEEVADTSYDHSKETFRLYSKGEIQHVSYSKCIADLKRKFYNIPEDARDEAINIFSTTQSIQSLADYTSAFTYATKRRSILDKDNTNKALAYLMSDLLFHCEPTDCTVLMRTIERLYDQSSSVHGHHPNEAEMLALCNHPQHPAQEMTREDFGHITAAATGITRFLDKDVPLTWETVEVWGKIGTFSHSFLKWKYDAQRVWDRYGDHILFPALLEEWCMQRLDDDLIHGSGYILAPHAKSIYVLSGVEEGNPHWQEFDSRSLFLLRHSHMIISHPERGTLIIKNASPIYGRDKFTHTAYYSTKGIGSGFSSVELEHISPSMLNRDFKPILDAGLNSSEDRLSNIAFLVAQLKAIDADYARWKFDTNYYTAWATETDHPSEDALLGGFYSEGYESTIEWLKAKHSVSTSTYSQGSSNSPLPELSFVHPDYPPLHAYPYQLNGKSELRRSLSINAETLELLKLHRGFQASEDDLERTGIRNFFQIAGFDTKAELILSSPLSDHR